MTVFILKAVEIRDGKRPDGGFDTWTRELGVFDSVAAAERMIAAAREMESA